MSFGICSAPEVFQRRMHQLIEGLNGVKVVADNFVVVGFGGIVEAAVIDHDQKLEAFMQRGEDRGIKLNAEVSQRTRGSIHRHVAIDKELCLDLPNIRAIIKMPPTDVTAIQRLLGMTQYLSKFLPHLSDITKMLRDITQNTAWIWNQPQQRTLVMLKQAVTSTPILRYYNLEEEVTLQCGALLFGLGAALMQNGHPVAYASRELTSAETRYAEIEKELLSIVFGCDCFEAYIHGRILVYTC